VSATPPNIGAAKPLDPPQRAGVMVIAGVVVVLLAVLIAGENAIVAQRMQHLPRLATDFSATYLDRELQALAEEPPQTVFLGDSVLWGYGVPAGDIAVARLSARGLTAENLAFKAANPANDFFLLRLLHDRGVRPRRVVLEINQQVFNPFDQSYRALHPGVLALARPLLTPADVRRLRVAPDAGPQAALERAASNLWLVYGMRSDLRESLFERLPTPPPHIASDMFAMTYDQAPLRKSNVGLVYLRATAALLASTHTPALAFLTPVNHALLHEFIDNPQYGANKRRLVEALSGHGIVTVDFDSALPSRDFFDNDHLNPQGQRDLAELLAGALAKTKL